MWTQSSGVHCKGTVHVCMYVCMYRIRHRVLSTHGVAITAHGTVHDCNEGAVLLEVVVMGAAAWGAGGDRPPPGLKFGGGRRPPEITIFKEFSSELTKNFRFFKDFKTK